MIVIPLGNYKLKQAEGSEIIKVFFNGQFVKNVLNCILTDDKAKAIVLETGR